MRHIYTSIGEMGAECTFLHTETTASSIKIGLAEEKAGKTGNGGLPLFFRVPFSGVRKGNGTISRVTFTTALHFSKGVQNPNSR